MHPHAGYLAAALFLCEEPQQETLPKWKAIGRPTPSPVGWDATHELLMVLFKVPHSSFLGPTSLFPRLFHFYIPSLGQTWGTQLEPTLAHDPFFFCLYRQWYWHPIKRDQKCSLNISSLSWKSRRIGENSSIWLHLFESQDVFPVIKER